MLLGGLSAGSDHEGSGRCPTRAIHLGGAMAGEVIETRVPDGCNVFACGLSGPISWDSCHASTPGSLVRVIDPGVSCRGEPGRRDDVRRKAGVRHSLCFQ
jgi:hypothetical protein